MDDEIENQNKVFEALEEEDENDERKNQRPNQLVETQIQLTEHILEIDSKRILKKDLILDKDNLYVEELQHFTKDDKLGFLNQDEYEMCVMMKETSGQLISDNLKGTAKIITNMVNSRTILSGSKDGKFADRIMKDYRVRELETRQKKKRFLGDM